MVLIGLVGLVAAFFLATAPRITDQWEKAAVLPMGKYRGLKSPGFFCMVLLPISWAKGSRAPGFKHLTPRLSGFMWERHLAANNSVFWRTHRGKMPLPQVLNLHFDIKPES